MQMGMIGLGRLGANMVRRLTRGGLSLPRTRWWMVPTAVVERGVHYVDCGTSGGVVGLERGYCLMIGGETDVVRRLDPIFATLAPGAGSSPKTPGRETRNPTAEQGYLHCGPNGAGHFVKMVHNGIEYGMMGAYAEGLNILKHAGIGNAAAADEAVPAGLLAAALFARFTSRGQADFQNRLLSAMRSEFGGHAEKTAGT
jgi:6-phosphogluconate dehydrogenase (decarboxylating)